MKKLITHEELKERLSYNQYTGEFTWLSLSSKRLHIEIGSIAGSLKRDGYVSIQVNKVAYKAHRLAWFYFYGIWPKEMIDHIDGNKTNNSISNLREATRSENGQNQKKPTCKNKLGVLGVTLKDGKYEAQIKINYKQFWLGSFKTIEEASNAYILAKRELHPFGTL